MFVDHLYITQKKNKSMQYPNPLTSFLHATVNFLDKDIFTFSV